MCQRITVRWLSTHETVFCGMYFKVSYKFGRKVSNIVNLSEARYSTEFFPTVWFLKGELWRLMLCNWNLWSEVNEVKNKDIGRGRVWYRCNSSLRFRNFICTFLTRELCACARASYRYDVGNGIRSLDWSIPVNFF